MTDQYHDKFTEPTREIPERSGFVCESCEKTYAKEEALKRDLTCCNRTMKELLQESFGP